MTKIFFALLTIPVTLVLNGLVISTLWEWFIVPKFDLPTITILEGVAVALVAGMASGYGYSAVFVGELKHPFDEASLGDMVIFTVKTIFMTAGLPLFFGWLLFYAMQYMPQL